MTHITFKENKIWCPLCQEYEIFLRIPKAAELADLTRRTIYRYLDEGKIHHVKTAGGTFRVCSGCLIKSE